MSGSLGASRDGLLAAATSALGRFGFAPVSGIVDGVTESVSAGESGIGRASVTSGRFAAAAAQAPLLPLLMALGVLLALVLALVSRDVLR